MHGGHTTLNVLDTTIQTFKILCQNGGTPKGWGGEQETMSTEHMDTLRNIERKIDDYHKSNSLFQLSLPIFILKLLEVVETVIFIFSENSVRVKGN